MTIKNLVFNVHGNIYETEVSVRPVYNHDGRNVTFKHLNLDVFVVNVHYKHFYFTAVKVSFQHIFTYDYQLVSHTYKTQFPFTLPRLVVSCR